MGFMCSSVTLLTNITLEANSVNPNQTASMGAVLSGSTLFVREASKLRSEIVWHRFFAVPAFICRFRSYIAMRKLFLKTSHNFSSRFRACACVWLSSDIFEKSRNTPAN